MTIAIREVDVRAERDALVRFLVDNLDGHGGEVHFEWLYLGNPAGIARAWLAVEGSEIVGVAASFPRKVYVRGEPIECGNLGDFAIRKDRRSLGPAIALQRACLEPTTSGRVPFAYDHPSCGMMAVYRWMKIEGTGRVVRHAIPLRVDGRVRRALGDGALARGIAGLGNVALGAAALRVPAAARGRLKPLEARFDARFDALDAAGRATSPVIGVRDAVYLNWRHLDGPPRPAEVLTYEDDTLRGYAVYRRETSTVRVTDLFVPGGAVEIERALLAGVAEIAGNAGADSLSVPVLDSTRLSTVLASSGFRARESVDFVVSTQSGGPYDGLVNQARNWFHTDGDRDV